jgi:hypothetical protein
MDANALDVMIRELAAYFTGPDAPANQNALSLQKGGRFQLRERAERFFTIREQLGISGLIPAEKAEVVIRRKLGL